MAKFRIGFVSNSSSSSFVIVGTEVNFNKIQEKGKEIMVLGKSLGDGQDYFQLTAEIYDYLSARKELLDNSDLKFYHVISEGEFELEIDRKTLLNGPAKIKIISAQIDYHQTETLEQFKERYEEGRDE